MADKPNLSASQNADQGMRNAAKTATNTARGAKAAKQIASQAASGNYIGAALTALKNIDSIGDILKVIIAPILSISLLITAIFSSLPSTIYEGIQSYTQSIETTWKDSYYDGTNGRVYSFIKAALNTGKRIVEGEDYADTNSAWAKSEYGSSWNNIKSKAKTDNSTDSVDKDTITDDDLYVVVNEGSAKAVMERKIMAAQDKVSTRIETIEEKISASVNGGAINDYFKALAKSRYPDGEFRGVNLTTTTDNLSFYDAVQLMSIYTTQINDSPDHISYSDFMKWLGYYDEFNSHSLQLTVDGLDSGFTYSSWSGTCMPQYLYEEYLQSGNDLSDYKQYQCAAIDLLLQVDVQPLDSAYEMVTMDRRTRYVNKFNEVTHKMEPVEEEYYVPIVSYALSAGVHMRSVSDVAKILGLTLDESVAQAAFSGAGGSGGYIWPTNNTRVITSPVGGRVSPGGIGSTNHMGVDIGASFGTPILASKAGKVSLASWNGGYGNCVIIDHGNSDTYTLYGHMSRIAVTAGQTVTQGQVIGYVGSTGNSTGPHIHFEIHENGVLKNPLDYLKDWIKGDW